MVTAGVYMVARSHIIFEHAPSAMMVVAIIGTLTALFAATIGIAQTDIKKVLAYSTVSQLGYMFMACGVGAFSAGVFHLMTHAFFKGLLFLAAGSVIHGIAGEQDMRKMGGLRHYMPWTFMTMTIATFAIAGFPPSGRLFLERRNSVEGVFEPLWQLGFLDHRRDHRFHHFLLYVPAVVLDILRRLSRRRGSGRCDPPISRCPCHARRRHTAHTGTIAWEHGHGSPHESPWVMLAPSRDPRLALDLSEDGSGSVDASSISLRLYSKADLLQNWHTKRLERQRAQLRDHADDHLGRRGRLRIVLRLALIFPPAATPGANRQQPRRALSHSVKQVLRG